QAHRGTYARYNCRADRTQHEHEDNDGTDQCDGHRTARFAFGDFVERDVKRGRTDKIDAKAKLFERFYRGLDVVNERAAFGSVVWRFDVEKKASGFLIGRNKEAVIKRC